MTTQGFTEGSHHKWTCPPECAIDHRTKDIADRPYLISTYAIQAQYVHTTSDGYTSSRQVPTFYLNANVQGIANVQHAERIARDILTAAVREMPINDALHIHVKGLS